MSLPWSNHILFSPLTPRFKPKNWVIPSFSPGLVTAKCIKANPKVHTSRLQFPLRKLTAAGYQGHFAARHSKCKLNISRQPAFTALCLPTVPTAKGATGLWCAVASPADTLCDSQRLPYCFKIVSILAGNSKSGVVSWHIYQHLSKLQ